MEEARVMVTVFYGAARMLGREGRRHAAAGRVVNHVHHGMAASQAQPNWGEEEILLPV